MATSDQRRGDWLSRVRSLWNDRAPDWDRISEANALSADRTADIARLAVTLDLHHGSTLLDAGCGTGQWAIAFATLGCAVTAQDLAPAMVDRAREHARDRNAPVTFRTGDICELPDPANTYDAVHARVIVHLVPEPGKALAGFRRVLKPGGRLFVSVPGALSPIYGRSWRRHMDPANVGTNYMVPWELEMLLLDGGWRILDQWGEYGNSMDTIDNPLEAAVRHAPVVLKQAAATTWGFVAT